MGFLITKWAFKGLVLVVSPYNRLVVGAREESLEKSCTFWKVQKNENKEKSRKIVKNKNKIKGK